MKFLNAGLAVVLLTVLGLLGWKTLSPSKSAPASYSLQVTESQSIFIPLIQFMPTETPTPTPPPTPTTPPTPVTPPHAPLFSTSYYMLTVDSTTLYNMGCKIGQVDLNLAGSRDSVVILDFGSPKKIGTEYGADLFWMGPVTISQISAAVKNFSAGYYTCVASDRSSRIYIGIGTTNYHTSISNTTDFTNHGVAWARMVNDLNAWSKTQGYSGQVLIVGANDVELAWNTPAITKAWSAGYDTVNQYDWYDYGSLDGCATRSNPNSTICSNGWTREDAWNITYGTLPVWPLPLIYATNGVNAQQWALLSLYSYNTRGYSFIFMGEMTQKQACDQYPGQCPGLDNTPAQGWNQLYNELLVNPKTAFVPPWSTDIKWWNGVVTMAATVQPAPQTVNGSGLSLYESIAQSLQQELASSQLNDAERAALQGKLQNALRVVSEQAAGMANPASNNPKALPEAPKVLDPSFQSGIFDGPGGIFHSWDGDFQNHWQGLVNGQFVFISAGATANDSTQGILVVTTVSADRLDVQKQVYLPAPGTGMLEVVKVEGTDVFLASKNGQQLVFDFTSRQFK